MLANALLLAGLALPAQTFGHVLHHALEAVPRTWSKVAEPAADQTISLEIELKLSNIDQMVEALYAVSTPGNAKYGQHYTREQVTALVSPSDAATQATVGWLNSSGIEDYTTTWKSVKFTTTVNKANSLLNTTFAVYKSGNLQKLRTTQYSVGDSVAQHIDLIHPTTFFGKTTRHSVSPVVDAAPAKLTPDANCTTGLSPRCVRQLYNIPLDYAPYNNAGAYLGFGSFLGQSAQESDLALFDTRYGFKNQSFAVQLINGGVNVQNSSASDGEANLDAQNLNGVSHPIPIIEYVTGGTAPFNPDPLEPAGEPSNEPYLEYYTYLLSQTNQQLPQIITNSYGDEEQTVPNDYAIRTCNLMGMMGLRGITLLESSGDGGVGASCISTGANPVPQLNPIFPATCPYITAVGGTQNIPEIAWVGSSGGFSFIFPRPSYQETAVNTYLNKHVDTNTAIYLSKYTNFSGRAFPDISAMSVSPFYYGYYQGRLGRNGGTSASSPTVAGILGLINDARLHAGKSALGFLNPFLYSSGYKTLTDITQGFSIGCNGNDTQGGPPVVGGGIIPYAQWNATAGWDPTTGWGVPNFQKMIAGAWLRV